LNPSAIVKPYQEKVYQKGNVYCCFNADAIKTFNPEMLDSAYWQRQDAVTGSAQGRGTTWFVEYDALDKSSQQKQQWVLRHYFRGGLIGKIIHDKYLFLGQNNTRAAQEYRLLNTLQRLELPAPKPIAYRVKRKGLFYQADLLSSRIEQAQDLVALLSIKALPINVWLEVGRVIHRFHKAGIYHHDLNAHNILLDENKKVWLIDFDQGEQRPKSTKWQHSNMKRLLRSFKKEKERLPNFCWREDNWQALLEGYLSEN
jgi:3-deoxy-D-manno-octulosonic acid kinase